MKSRPAWLHRLTIPPSKMIHPRIQNLLTSTGTRHQVHVHANLPVPVRSPADFANAIGYSAERIAKTLFLKDTEGKFILATLPAPLKVDFDAVARAVGAKRVQMGSPDELAATLGYPRNGVSPLGAEGLAVVLDQSLLAHETILVGGGVAGEEVEISSKDLQALSHASIAPIAVR